MTDQIQLRLEKTRDGIIFQVLEQPHQLRWIGYDAFRSSVGWTVSAVCAPALAVDSRVIYLRGDEFDYDSDIRLVVDVEDIDHTVNEIVQTMQEFVNSDVYKKAVNKKEVPTSHHIYTFS